MIEITHYYGHLNGLRGNFTGLPLLARLVVGIFALPGLILLGLSILVFVVSVLALLLLTAPVYLALKSLANSFGASEIDAIGRSAKRVDAKIVE